MIPTVNFHFLKQCNLSCTFCYAHFYYLEKEKLLPLESMFQLITNLKQAGCRKINFAGGEPFIYAEILGQLIKFAYEIGLKTSVVTNGTLLKLSWLKDYGFYLNWMALSCDSALESVQKALGRGRGNHVSQTIETFTLIRKFNESNNKNSLRIRTKLNSVITRLNFEEDMSKFVSQCDVERWKILQILPIEGENDEYYPMLSITEEQFHSFVNRHKSLEKRGINVVSENNNLMTESYLMVDPQGRFFQNRENRYHVSAPILEIGVEQALEQVGFSEEKFLKRGGLYDF